MKKNFKLLFLNCFLAPNSNEVSYPVREKIMNILLTVQKLGFPKVEILIFVIMRLKIIIPLVIGKHKAWRLSKINA